MNRSTVTTRIVLPAKRAGFTLLEMVIVVSVLAVLTALIAPAMTSLGRSTGLVTGGNIVTNLVSYARQMAVAKNTMTAVVVLAGQDSPDDYTTLTVLTYDPVSGWAPISEWKKLPTGIVFDPDEKASSFFANSPTFPLLTLGNQKNPPVQYLGQPIKDPAGYRARIFLPSGGLQNPEDPAQLRLIEGFMQNGQAVRTRRSGAAGSSNYYDVAIIGSTGTTKVTRP